MKMMGMALAVGSLVFLSACANHGYYRGDYTYYGRPDYGSVYGNGYYGSGDNYYRDRRGYGDRYRYNRRY